MLSIRLVLFGFVLIVTNHFGTCNVLRETESDEREKRAVGYPNSGITLNFQHGMRDFIINGKGVGIHTQTLVAFQATLTTGDIGPNYADGAIKFNDVSLNVGNGYNPSTGIFTAPIGGIYQFSISYLQKNGISSHVRLVKGSTVVSDLTANHKSHDQLSKTILVALKKGETFWVKLVKNVAYAVYGRGRYTEFGGHLISANY